MGLILPGFWKINFVLPHSFLCALFEVDNLGNLVANAHVGSVIVVEVNVSFYDLVGMLKGVEADSIDAFYLYLSFYTILPFVITVIGVCCMTSFGLGER